MADCSFEGRVALVTGGGAGLGRQYVIDLARGGAKVMVNSFVREPGQPSKAAALAQQLAAEGLNVAHDTADMSIEAQAREAVEHTVREFGRIDILINNAGGGGVGTAQETSTEALRAVLEVHVFGMFWAMQQALQHMRAQDYGRIVNTGSGLGAFGADAMLPYVTAKSAILGMTKAAAHDNRDKNIRINTLLPIAYTQMGASFDHIHPRFTEDRLNVSRVSPVALYLSSEGCPLTGESLHAAGGRAALIFNAVVRGYSSDSLTCQDLLDHTDEVMDPKEHFILRHFLDQYPMIP